MFVCPECGETHASEGFCPADGTPLAARGDDALLGATAGAYRMARLLGVGGMGRVYKGVHPGIGSRVAIKVLSHDTTARPDLVDRFFAEARAVNLIRHENIVNVLDLNTLPDGRPFIVMEYLDGAPLSEVLARRGPLPLGTLARIAGDILDALGAAHSKAIVHRDLKPDNIFVTPQGRAKILDFGIAKLMPELGGGSSPTRTGALLGTPHYMAPEQAHAQPVDRRTDLYAIGIILYECATGQRPFEAASLFELLRKQVEDEPIAPRHLRADLPPTYEAVILRALAKDPQARFQSAAELAQALGSAASALPAEAWAPVSSRAGVLGSGVTPIGPTPTPPHAELPSPHAATEPGTPPRTPQDARMPPPGQATWSAGTTVSGAAGEKPAQPRQSTQGLWLGLGLVALAAVGAALAVVLTGDDGPAATPAGEEPVAVTRADAAPHPVAPAPVIDAGAPTPVASAPTDAAPKRATPHRPRAAPPIDAAVDPHHAARLAVLREAAKRNPGLIIDGDGGISYVPPGTFKPPGFDPSAFDVSGFLPRARKLARDAWSDAQLVRIDAANVRTSGLADLTLVDNSYVLYRFVSPSRARRPADLPLGVEHKGECLFYVWVDTNGVRPYPVKGWKCDEPVVPVPRCSLAQVWNVARSKGAPAGNVVATIGYWSARGTARWYFGIDDVMSEFLPDSCK